MPDESPIWIERIDSGDSVSYYGFALKGSATTAASWYVKRITRTNNDAVEAWASTQPNQVWDDRATLVYD